MEIGDLVINPPNPHWGIGIVIEVENHYIAPTAQVQWNHGLPMWMWFKHLVILE
jgi:hypothetical protein